MISAPGGGGQGAAVGAGDGRADPDDLSSEVPRVAWHAGVPQSSPDRVAREEPLEIRVSGVPVTVVMRTPGHDEELVTGFLLAEGIVGAATDLASVRESTVAPRPEAEGNVIEVVLAPGVEVDLARLRRNLYAASSCGVCGKASLAQVLDARPRRRPGKLAVSAALLARLPAALRAAQGGFDVTGGLHAAGLFDAGGRAIVVREDVGRHNAVDKVLGWAARSGVDPAQHILMVSGRVSFEITQKAVMAAIPVLAAVSAPSSLAIELAREAGVTLVAFVRDQRLSVYAGDLTG